MHHLSIVYPNPNPNPNPNLAIVYSLHEDGTVLAVVSGDADCFSNSAEAEIVCIAVVALYPKMYNLARSPTMEFSCKL